MHIWHSERSMANPQVRNLPCRRGEWGKIFLTCCAFHNWLLDDDGLSEPWDGRVATTTPAGGQDDEVQGSWDGEMGQYDEEDFAVLPAAIRNLNNPIAMRSYDLSGMGPGSDAILTDCDELESYDLEERIAVGNDNSTDDQVELVRKLSLAKFRQRLIIHFDIAYH